jgi:hypothetical protein
MPDVPAMNETLPIRMGFRYLAAPLKVVGGSGAPVNPIAIR